VVGEGEVNGRGHGGSVEGCGNGGQCVEVAVLDTAVVVRDSKEPRRTVLGFTRREWGMFVTGVRSNRFGRG
jgi:hypothetical protein